MGAYVEWDALAKILLFGILLGAGLPALYAAGVRSLDASIRHTGGAATARKVGAYAAFGVIVAAIIGALLFIVAGGH